MGVRVLIYPKPGTPDGFFVSAKKADPVAQYTARKYFPDWNETDCDVWETDIVRLIPFVEYCIKQRIYFRFEG